MSDIILSPLVKGDRLMRAGRAALLSDLLAWASNLQSYIAGLRKEQEAENAEARRLWPDADYTTEGEPDITLYHRDSARLLANVASAISRLEVLIADELGLPLDGGAR